MLIEPERPPGAREPLSARWGEQCVHGRRPGTCRTANRIPCPHCPADVPPSSRSSATRTCWHVRGEAGSLNKMPTARPRACELLARVQAAWAAPDQPVLHAHLNGADQCRGNHIHGSARGYQEHSSAIGADDRCAASRPDQMFMHRVRWPSRHGSAARATVTWIAIAPSAAAATFLRRRLVRDFTRHFRGSAQASGDRTRREATRLRGPVYICRAAGHEAAAPATMQDSQTRKVRRGGPRVSAVRPPGTRFMGRQRRMLF